LIDVVSQTQQTGGAIVIELSGGSAPYDFFWEGPNDYSGTIQNPFDLAAGSYDLTVTDGNGCTATFNVVVDFSSATKDVTSAKGNLTLMPNPASSYVEISIGESTRALEIVILNNNGTTVYRATPNGIDKHRIDIPAHWSPGVYLVSALDRNGKVIATAQLIRIID
jgi:hypothetical protein